MAAPVQKNQVKSEQFMKITRLKVRKGQRVSKGSLICLYTGSNNVSCKLKSNYEGIIQEIFVKDGEELEIGRELVTIEGCSHPTVMKDMCADCGADLRMENSSSGRRKEEVSASVAMIHSIPELIVSEKLAKELGRADEERLLKTRKLVLLVDLDQTLIHTTNDNIPPNLKDVHHYQLWHGPHLLWYHTRLRPRTQQFLDHISQLYELHICTFGSRIYAHTIAKILDPKGKYFSHRILSRDECFNASSKTANLKALFPCGDSMVCIIDDREDVWNFAANLIHVKPYRFFQGTADINAPPGLTKTEQDDQPVTHRVRRVSQSSTNSTDSNDNICKAAKSGEKKSGDQSESGQSEVKKSEGEHGETSQADSGKGDSELATDGDKQQKEKVTSKSESPEKEKSHQVNEEDTEKSDDNEAVSEIDAIETGDKKEVYEKDSIETGEKKEVNEKDSIETGEKNEVNEKDSIETGEKKEVNEKDSIGTSEKKEANEKYSVETDEKKEVSTSEDSCDRLEMDFTDMPENEDVNETDKKDNDKSDSDKKSMESDKKEKKVSDDKSEENNSEEQEGELIEWDDEDDYLFHLEEILSKIHETFFDMYDQVKDKKDAEKPNLRKLVPYIKKKVLKGCNLLFSGVIPTNMQAEKSRAYIVAKSLGANIHQEVKTKHNEKDEANFTTHLVASRLGTQKVRSVMRHKKVKVVTPEWLWCCAERWERAEEILFPLNSETTQPGRDSPDLNKMVKKSDLKRKIDSVNGSDSNSGSEKRPKTDENNSLVSIENKSNAGEASTSQAETIKDKKFSMTYNPMLAFSDDDLAYMDKEVEDEIGDEDESSEEDEDRDVRLRTSVLKDKERMEVESSSDDSMCGDMPRGWGLHKKMSPKSSSEDEETKAPTKEVGSEYESETDQDKFDKIMDAFGPETENSDDEYQESIGSVDDELAKAVELEFLS